MAANSLVPLSAGIIYICLLVVVILDRQWQKEHKLFALYLVAAMLWSFSTFLLRSPLLIEHKLLLFRIVVIASVWWIIQLYYFVRVFLSHRADFWTFVGYASLSASIILAVFDVWPMRFTFRNGVVSPYLGWFGFLYVATIMTYPVLGLYSLVRRFAILTESQERNKIAYLLVAISLLVVFGLAGVTPLADEFPISHLGGLLSACIFTYAIVRHELVSINSILRRSLGWLSLFVIGAGSYLLVFYLLQLLLDLRLEPITYVLATLVAAGVAIAVYRIRFNFLEAVDRLFYGETYDYRQMLLRLSDQISNVLDLGDLAQTILTPVVEAMHAKRAALLLPQVESGDFNAQFVQQADKEVASVKLRLADDNPIVSWLTAEGKTLRRELIDVIPQLKGLWERERQALNSLEVELLCPVRSKGRLSGILAVGAKKTGVPYSDEEVGLLMTMANETAVAIENARMLESLRIEQLRVKRLLEQLSHTQEEERKRISADLHDSVAQWLAAASYRAQAVNALLSGGSNDKARDELDAMESTIDKSLKELRRVVIALRPPALEELGLDHALKQSLEELRADGVECRFGRTGESFRLPLDVEIAVYRVVQEAINNIRKHARATRASLNLRYREDRLQVEVRDNGRGFDLSRTLDSAISAGHMGLLGMKERVEALGGDVRIRTSQDGGTLITLSFPIQSPVEER